MPKRIYLNGFTQCCVNHHSEGQWKNPLDGTVAGYKDIGYWVDLARTLERGGFDCLFLADVHGTYSVYKGSRASAVRHGVQFPTGDPTVIIPAMAYATQNLGFACTFSTTYFPPYQTAKLFSTLDHLTNGRVGWNIVTSYLADANANFGVTENLTHDQRYDRAEEYMEVVYKLWEHSWEDGAIKRDKVHDMFIDSAMVHEINHVGPWFNVPGPHLCEPSPQRTPILFQAGQSGRGSQFAATHAEAIFCVYPNIVTAASGVAKLREAIAACGRARSSVKVFQGVSVVVAPTDEEARSKFESCRRYASPEGALALFSGWVGVDLSELRADKQLDSFESNAIQGLLGFFKDVDSERAWTVRDIADFMAVGSIMPKIVGSPATVVDALEQWVEEADLDGFNLTPVLQPSGFSDFVEWVVPELQRRGRLPRESSGGTLRERFFGTGQLRLAADHIAHRTLPQWKVRSLGDSD